MIPAMKIDQDPGSVRRFGTADLSEHGGWIIKRLLKAFPHQNERGLASWLRETINSNTSLFLYLDHGVALFQVQSSSLLEHKPMVYERFVFVEEGHVLEGVEFYGNAYEWAKNMGVEQIVVEVNTDVPHDMIFNKLGRLYSRQQIFAKV